MPVLHDDVPWPLTTDRLLLRAGTAADADAVWAYRRLPEVARWQTTWHRDRAEFVAGFALPDRLAPTVMVESGGVVIGDLMVRIEDGWGQTEVAEAARGTQAELGWTFDPAHQGRGLATEAVGRIITACFDDLGLRRLIAGRTRCRTRSWCRWPTPRTTCCARRCDGVCRWSTSPAGPSGSPTSRVRLADADVASPVVLGSGWMAGTPSVVLAQARPGRSPADHIDIDILFALADAAGPDSLTGFVDLDRPFTVHEHGSSRTVRSLTGARRARFGDGRVRRTRRISSPEHETVVASGLAAGSSVRIAFDNRLVGAALTGLVRSGLWGWLPRAMRRALLGGGRAGQSPQPHEVLLTARDRDGTTRIRVHDPLGQAHLTAAGAVNQAERLLGLRARRAPAAGFSCPEQAADLDADLAALREMGVETSVGRAPG